MKQFRLALELLGVSLYVGAHFPIALFYALGSSLQGVFPVPYWAAIGLGYLLMAGVAFARPARLRTLPSRRAFDTWLLAAVPALALCAILIWSRWPLAFPSWDAHGFGAMGGEANAVFFPWLHSLLWVLAANLWRSPDPQP
jgi:hypothetical protein